MEHQDLLQPAPRPSQPTDASSSTPSRSRLFACDRHADVAYKHLNRQHVDEVDNAKSPTEKHERSPTRTWLPRSMQWPFLVALFAISAVLFIITMAIYVRSLLNSGLVDDDGSNGLIFASRFLPPALAVGYGVALMVLLEDIKRTEPFSRLSMTEPPLATATMLMTQGPWWQSLLNSFPNRRQRRVTSWAMLAAVLAYVLGFLVLSPLSATFLASKPVTFYENMAVSRALVPQQGFEVNPQDPTYFRTIAFMYRNISASAWITESFTALPFGPRTLGQIPIGPALAQSDQAWTATTTLFSVNASCQELQLQNFRTIGITYANGTLSGRQAAVVDLQSTGGCSVTVRLGGPFAANGGWLWAKLPAAAPDPGLYAYDLAATSVLDSNCPTGEVIMWTNKAVYKVLNNQAGAKAVEEITPDAHVDALFCTTHYMTANASTRASTIGRTTMLEVDDAQWQPVSDLALDVDAVRSALFHPNWSQHVINMGTEPLQLPDATGPASLIMALYNSSVPELIEPADLMLYTYRIRNRFMGELLADSFPDLTSEPAGGTLRTSRRRIVASEAAAIGICAVLAAHMICLLAILFAVRPRYRSMGLSTDSGIALTVAGQLSRDSSARPLLQHREKESPKRTRKALSTSRFHLISGTLSLKNREDGHESHPVFETNEHKSLGARPGLHSVKASHSNPLVWRWWSLMTFTVVVAALIAIIATLYDLSRRGQLFDKAFVYEARLTMGDSEFGVMSPASVITALVAVGISLWFGALEFHVRTLAPFRKLSTTTEEGSNAATYSYQSRHFLWCVPKAVANGDYMLSLLSLGATLAQALTISMSALWQLGPGVVTRTASANHTLQIRQIPRIFLGFTGAIAIREDPVAMTALQRTYSNLQNNWRYSAAMQLTLNSTVAAKTRLHTSSEQSMALNNGDVNITIETPAIHGRLECSQINELTKPSRWLTQRSLTNTTIWNNTDKISNREYGWTLGCNAVGNIGFDSSALQFTVQANESSSDACGAQYYTSYRSFFSNTKIISCCDNSGHADAAPISEADSSSIGYWSPLYFQDLKFPKYSRDWPANFTVKWIHGDVLGSVSDLANRSEAVKANIDGLVWTEPPKMTALNCRPVMETAMAKVTVSGRTSQVYGYEILGETTVDEIGWLDVAVHRNQTPGSDDAFDDELLIINIPTNVTISHNVLFLLAMLGAADVNDEPSIFPYVGDGLEPFHLDRSFAVRTSGLNVDYMSYSMLQMVNDNRTALLDPNELYRTANKTFSTFFQHFVSSNTSLATGGWAYSQINEPQAHGLGDRVDFSPDADYFNARPLAPATSFYNGPLESEVEVSIPVETLQMSPTAAFISMSILGCLLVILALAAFTSKHERSLLRNVDCVADVALLLANSDHLLRLIERRGVLNLIKDSTLRTRLGWFRGVDGILCWGIELVSCEDDGNGQPIRGPVFLTDAEARFELSSLSSGSGSSLSEKSSKSQHMTNFWPWKGRRNRKQTSSLGSAAALLSPRNDSDQPSFLIKRKPVPISSPGVNDPFTSDATRSVSMTSFDSRDVSMYAPSLSLPSDLSTPIDMDLTGRVTSGDMTTRWDSHSGRFHSDFSDQAWDDDLGSRWPRSPGAH